MWAQRPPQRRKCRGVNYVWSAKARNVFDLVVRPHITATEILILVAVKDVSVTLICFLYFYF